MSCFRHWFGVPWTIATDTGTAYQRYASAAAVSGKSAVAVEGLPANGKMLHVPSPNPTVSRRRVLVGAAALALLGASVAACGSSPPPPEVDELAAQLERARSDSQLATDAAAAARGATAQALNAVAVRAVGTRPGPVRRTCPDARSGRAHRDPDQHHGRARRASDPKDVIAALRESADSATELAAKMSGYRAGLLGSIAAACTAAYTVALVPPEKPQ